MTRGILMIGLVMDLAFAFTDVTSAASCDRTCLLEHAKQFNANMLAHTTEKIPLAPNVQIRENTKAITLADSKWSGVKKDSFGGRIR